MALFQCAYQPFINNLIWLGKEIYGDTEDGLKQYGSVIGYKDLLWIGIYLALVPVMRKLHPVKAGLLGYGLMIVAALAGAFLVRDETSFRIITIVTFATVGIYLVGTAALPARLLPREKYGQFSSAGAIVFRLSVALVSTPAGLFLQHFGSRHIFTWLLTFLLLGGICMTLLYIDWKRLGGDKDFVPPST
jgi:predicted MFS family arabinose efflux permease